MLAYKGGAYAPCARIVPISWPMFRAPSKPPDLEAAGGNVRPSIRPGGGESGGRGGGAA